MKNTLLTNLKYLVTSVSMILFGLTAGQLVAQVDCDVVTVTCNDLVQVSLNSACEQALDFDMIVENPEDDGTYTVTLSDVDGNPIFDTNGVEITDNVVTLAQAGDTIMVTALLNECGLSCWGFASVFDKLPPAIECADVRVPCDAEAPYTCKEPSIISNNCDGVTLTYEDLNDGIMCIEGPTLTTPVVEFTGTLTPQSPTFNRPDEDGVSCELSEAGTNVAYETFDFILDTDCTVDFEVTMFTDANENSYLAIYENCFDPLDPCANYIASNDAGGVGSLSELSVMLSTGVNYTLVMTTFNNDEYGDFTIDITTDGCDVLLYTDNATLTSYCSVIQRVWTATDGSGNTSTCTQSIYFESVTVDEVVFPDDFIVDYDLDSDCDDLDLEGVLPEVSGEPTFYGCPCLQFEYTDLPFEMCGASTKMLRTWFVVDWCSGEFREEGQNIEAFDDEAPVSQCGETCIEIFTTEGCATDFNIPVPVNGNLGPVDPTAPTYFDCSDVTFRIYIGFVDQDLFDIDPETDPCGEDFNDTDITYVEVLPNSRGEYIYPDVTVGLYWYRYEFIDACGNAQVDLNGDPTFCTSDVIVKDGTPPFAICEGNTKVSLNASLEVEVLAESIDDNSFDECGDIVLYEVKRIDNNLCESSDAVYGPTITFCCGDAHGLDIPVMLRVTDEFGNIDECVGAVCVSDFVTPVVLCPANDEDTIDCSDSYSDANFGDITVSSNCPGNFTPMTTFDETGLNECGVGVVIQTVTYTNSAGTVIGSCDLTINVVGDGGLLMSDITCPADVLVAACDGGYSPDNLSSKPIINSNSACTDIVMNFVDSEPFVDPGVQACYSITRKWTIIDWCTYDVDNPNVGEFFCSQQINFNSGSGPTFTTDCDEKINILDTDLDCEHEVPLVVFAVDEDGCTPSGQIGYTWELDLDDNGSIDATGTGNDATDVYPVGCHSITFYASDNCGNESECEIDFCVLSDKEPTPICRAELVWALGADGTTEVWASDFNIKSESACGTETELTYSFTADGLTQALEFTCDDIPNGIGAEISLNMYVSDSSGNSEFCQVTLILQDNLDACTDSSSGSAKVAGRVYDEFYNGAEQFEVELEDMSDAVTTMELTDEEGDYEFQSVEYYDSYVVEPVRNDLHKEGVSTLDIILIQRHILNLENLDSPYKLIAADANKSHSISAADIAEIRKLVLDIKDEYTDNTSWQFVDANQIFLDPTQPWEYETNVSIPALYIDYSNVEFVAVKTGDVNNSISFYLHNEETEVRSGDDYGITVRNQTFQAGQQVKVTLDANQTTDLYGAQFTLDFDQSVLAYLDFTEGQLGLDVDKVSTSKASAGQLAISADFVNGREITEGSELTSFYFIAQQGGSLSDVIDLTSNVTTAEVYDTNKEVMNITLDFDSSSQISNDLVVYQNEPNPFAATTVIPFYTTQESAVTLEVFDAAGKTLYQTGMTAVKGHNKFTLSAENVPSSGVLFYRVQSGKSIIVKKMILLDK